MGWFSWPQERSSSQDRGLSAGAVRKRSRRARDQQAVKRMQRKFTAGVEALESRLALSSLPGMVYSDLRVSPHATSSPSGYSPAQVAAAYGFNNVSFNGVKGDGSGETIAIVDAFDDPNILSHLAAFDQHYGLAS